MLQKVPLGHRVAEEFVEAHCVEFQLSFDGHFWGKDIHSPEADLKLFIGQLLAGEHELFDQIVPLGHLCW